VAGETIVFFPKYTTLVEGTYYSDPYELTSYKTAQVEIVNVAVINSATVTLQMEQSSDLTTWTNLGGTSVPTAGNVASSSLSGTSRYVRAKVTIGASGSSATIWCKAVARDA
jgi:hypothetical protein